MSALPRSVCLAALVGLIAVPAFAAGEVKGPVRISAAGVEDFGGDHAAFRAAMEADERGEDRLVAVSDARIVIHEAHRDALAEIRREARHAADEARDAARRARDEGRRAADCARAAALEAAREARAHTRELADAARALAAEAARTARGAALEAARDANREARRQLMEVRRAMRAHGRERARVVIHARGAGEMIEMRDGRIVRCSHPEKHPGTGCAPFSETEKADFADLARRAGDTAADALDRAFEALERLDIR